MGVDMAALWPARGRTWRGREGGCKRSEPPSLPLQALDVHAAAEGLFYVPYLHGLSPEIVRAGQRANLTTLRATWVADTPYDRGMGNRKRGGAAAEAERRRRAVETGHLRPKAEGWAWMRSDDAPIDEIPAEPAVSDESDVRQQLGRRPVASLRPYPPLSRSQLLAAVRASREVISRRQRELDGALAVRDDLIRGLRDLGVSWEQIAAAAGVSRQALVKRL